MPSATRPTQFGRIHAPDEAWLAQQPPEAILDPDLPIIDTHHHLWERPDHRYLLHEFLDDVRTGHNSWPRCSWSATPCTAPEGRRRCGRSARPSSWPAWRP